MKKILLALLAVFFFVSTAAASFVDVGEIPWRKKIYVLNPSAGLYRYAHRALGGKLVSTLVEAYVKVESGRGDIIVVLPGHTETLSSVLNIAKSDVSIVGIGEGGSIPIFTPALASSTLVSETATISITGDGVIVENIRFGAPSSQFNSLIGIYGADGTVLSKLSAQLMSSTSGVSDLIHIATGTTNLLVDDFRFDGSITATAAAYIYAPRSVINLKGRCDECTFKNVRGLTYLTEGATSGGIIDSAQAFGLYFEDINLSVTGISVEAVTLDSNPYGVVVSSYFGGTNTTITTNVNFGNLMYVYDTVVSDKLNNSQGGFIPQRYGESYE